MRYAFLAACALALAVTAPVAAQAYQGGAATFTGLGSDQIAFPGTQWDVGDFTGISGTYTGAGNYDLNSIAFTAGVNNSGTPVVTGDLQLTGLFDGSSVDYLVHYVIQIGAASDTITFGGNTVSFGGASWHLNEVTLSSDGTTNTGILSAIADAVPEPASWAMMLGGFGLIGGVMRSRKAAVSFA